MDDTSGAVRIGDIVRVAAIVPALNEGRRIKGVLQATKEARLVDEILVVSDGSTDDTCERAREVPGVRVLELPRNLGKAGAMFAGAHETGADVLLFLDADLMGLCPRHVDAIVSPVRDGSAEMCVGIFRGGRLLTDLAQKVAPVISGQRAIRRDMFLDIPEIGALRMGVEIALTKWAQFNGVCVSTVVLDGVTHPMKEEKLGFLHGFTARLRMYREIAGVMLDGKNLRKAPIRRAARPDSETTPAPSEER